MTMTQAGLSAREAIGGLIDTLCPLLLAAESELNALDRAIGDGDHGSNMARAARSLAEQRDELAALPPGEALNRAGRAIVMSVGGASGPLYGTLLMEMGKALSDGRSSPAWAEAFTAGVAAAARRGRSEEGDKTMLDVLGPAARALSLPASSDLRSAVSAMMAAAEQGLAAQRPLRARRGRAAYVGERSVGADDPGAVSSFRCLAAIADFLETRAP